MLKFLTHEYFFKGKDYPAGMTDVPEELAKLIDVHQNMEREKLQEKSDEFQAEEQKRIAELKVQSQEPEAKPKKSAPKAE